VVLRTGFDSAQGQLMRTILYSTERITANSAETGLFILFLLCFAVAAAGYVLYYGLQDPERSRYKLLLNCSLIITSVIPPELPMELTIAVNQSIIALHRMAIFCTEPFRIPFAGKVETCCFDKTGTLTSDDLVFEGLLLAGDIRSSTSADDLAIKRAIFQFPTPVVRVMAACQSLVAVGRDLVGDPLEKAAFAATGWVHANDTVASGRALPPSEREKVQIMHRFHFSSALKRMSTIVRVEPDAGGPASHWVVVKGAPEALQPLLAPGEGGDAFTRAYKRFASQGARIIALAYRQLPQGAQSADLRGMSREEAESGLTFGALAVFLCPIKPESEPALRMLKASNHRLVMITGDAALTACHVAEALHIIDRPALILTRTSGGGLGGHSGRTRAPAEQLGAEGKLLSDADFTWVSPDEALREPFSAAPADIAALAAGHDLCLAGDAIAHAHLAGCLHHLVPLTQVFARTSPDQKELIITTLKKAGRVTLMCGDGTNDVGSLKAAHIGVALLSASIVPARRRRGAAAAKPGRRAPAPPAPAELPAAPKTRKGAKPGRRGGTPAPQLENGANGAAKATEAGGQGSAMAAWLERLEQEDSPQIVKPGDASMAAPFTAREPNVMPCTAIIRQGRSTLVTTLQMFKILGLMCLTTAFSLSILYLEGIKLGDLQATASGLLSAALFFMLSSAKPVKQLSPQRPHSKIFCAYVFTSLLGQFAVHLTFLVFVYKASLAETPAEQRQQPDADFAPNLVNSACFLCSFAIQVTTFAVNYVGRPFNVSLTEHKMFFYTLLAAGGFYVLAVTQGLPPLNDAVELVALPPWLQVQLLLAAAGDLLATTAIERAARAAFPAPTPPSKEALAAAACHPRRKTE